MGLALPERGTRRNDLLVASLMGAWLFGWLVVDLVGRARNTAPNSFSVGLALVLLAATAIWLPFLYGVAKGRKWGFAYMAGLSLLGCSGSFLRPLMLGQPVTALTVASALVNAAMAVYCAVRLWQGRVRDDVPPLQKDTLRVADNVVGAGGALWVSALGAGIWKNGFQHSTRHASDPFWQLLGSLGLVYIVASLGVALGRRWGFVAMIVLSVAVLMGEVPLVLLPRRTVMREEVGIVVFNLLALVYCAIRLRRPKGVGDPSTAAAS